jgi:uncharacterized protein (TIGR03437 family)
MPRPTFALRFLLAQVAITFVPFFLARLCFSQPLPSPRTAQQTQAPQFIISTVAGDGAAGYSGDGGFAPQAKINDPRGVALDAQGNLYIADFANNRVRKVTPGGIITTVAGTGTAGYSGDGGPATAAALNGPIRVALDSSGNLFIADTYNYRARKVAAATGIITTVAGNGSATYSGLGGPAVDASIDGLGDVEPDTAGNLFITSGSFILKVDTSGTLTQFAGNGVQGFAGDGGPATQAELGGAVCAKPDSSGNLFITDQGSNRIREVSNGIITTVAGNGVNGFGGDGGLATAASLSAPACTSVDAAGNLYIADNGNNRIRVVLAGGVIETVAGNGIAGFAGDGGPALSAEMSGPHGVAITSSGAVYFADDSNERIRMLTPVLQPPSIGVGGVITASAFGGFTSIAPGDWIEIYGSNLAPTTRTWSSADFSGNSAPTELNQTLVNIGGKSAFIDYISPLQVNALVPSDAPTGLQQLTVTNAAGTSPPYNVTVNPTEPGLLAIPSFNINGIQYAVAMFTDGDFALPAGVISGITSRPAQPGDALTLYGLGFGPVTPSMQAGRIVGQLNTLASNFTISLSGAAVSVQYDGLAPNYTGLYQFNITVPDIASGNAPLTFTLGGQSGTQTLYVAIGN